MMIRIKALRELPVPSLAAAAKGFFINIQQGNYVGECKIGVSTNEPLPFLGGDVHMTSTLRGEGG